MKGLFEILLGAGNAQSWMKKAPWAISLVSFWVPKEPDCPTRGSADRSLEFTLKHHMERLTKTISMQAELAAGRQRSLCFQSQERLRYCLGFRDLPD